MNNAVCLCYCSPVPHVKLVVLVRPKRQSANAERPRAVHITSLDDTVESFRGSMRALFSGETPDELLVADDNGTAVKMQDPRPLSHYRLLCFQIVTACFLSPSLKSAPEAPVTGEACAVVDDASPSRDGGAHEPCATVRAVAAVDPQAGQQCAGILLSYLGSFCCCSRDSIVRHVFAHDACVAGCAALRPLSEFSNSQVAPTRRRLFLCLVLFIALICLNISYAEGQGRRIVSAAAVVELY